MKLIGIFLSLFLPILTWANLSSPMVITSDLNNYRQVLNQDFPNIHLRFKASADQTDEEILFSELQLVEEALVDPSTIDEKDKVFHLACCHIVCGGCKKETREDFDSMNSVNFFDSLAEGQQNLSQEAFLSH